MQNTQENNVRYIRKRKNYAAPVFGLWLFLLFCCLLATYFFLNSSFFALKSIEIIGNGVISDDEVIQLSGLTTGTNLFSLKTSEATIKIDSYPNIKKVEIKRKLPNTIIINVVERQPIAMVVIQNGYALVDNEGIILKKLEITDGSELPLISQIDVGENKRPGDSIITPGLKSALNIIKQMDDEFLENITEIIAPSQYSLTLKTKTGVKILFGEEEDIGRKIMIIEKFMKKNSASINEQNVEYIDLRYDTAPVIKRKY